MIVVPPISVTDAMLISSTVAEPDSGETVWSAGTHTKGSRRILTTTHRVYEVVASSTTDSPEAGVVADPPTWIDAGPTNRWAAFDGVIGAGTIAENEVVIELEPKRIITGLAVLNVVGVSKATVEIEDGDENIIYSREILLYDNSEAVDWWEFFFSEIVTKNEFVLIDLPGGYADALIRLKFEGDGEISIGEIIIGQKLTIGIACYGSELGLLDFSGRERNAFGGFDIVPRGTAKLVSFDVVVDTARASYTYQQVQKLSGYTTRPAVWVGTDADDDPTLIYGYFRDFRLVLDNISFSKYKLEVMGLI